MKLLKYLTVIFSFLKKKSFYNSLCRGRPKGNSPSFLSFRQEIKPKTPYGQLPVLNFDGVDIAQVVHTRWRSCGLDLQDQPAIGTLKGR